MYMQVLTREQLKIKLTWSLLTFYQHYSKKGIIQSYFNVKVIKIWLSLGLTSAIFDTEN